jgi:hypothetical protein
MNVHVVAGLRHELCCSAGIEPPVRREPIRVWGLSGVERLHLPDGTSVVFKYATEPFTGEDQVLAHAGRRGVPVPALHASTVRHGVLGMILEDLGEPSRPATDTDAADAAARLHAAGQAAGLPTLGEAALRALPSIGRIYLDQLHAAGRFADTADCAAHLQVLGRIAGKRAAGAELPPFGLCHGELHPTSLHVGKRGWRLLDLAKAFNGPGLLDLATWQGTRNPPDPTRLRQLIYGYIGAGGHHAARAERGQLPAEVWALGWHNLSAAVWFLQQAARGTHPPDTDHGHVPIVRRQLDHATRLLAS